MMKILVTGGGGMLATAIRNLTDDFGTDIVFYNRQELDITDLNKLFEYFNTYRFNYIINCAAYTNVEAAETNFELAYSINRTGAKNIAIAAKSIEAKLIHISTDAVYDGKKSGVYIENDVCNPLSAYSKSKYDGELEVIKSQCSGVIIRTSWLYSMDKPNFVTAIMNKANAKGNLNVVFDQLGTPTYTYDLAKAILHIVKSDNVKLNLEMDIYHYSNEGAISWYDFAVNICQISNVKANISPIKSDQYPSKVIRPFHAILSKDKIKAAFGLKIPYWLDSLNACLSNNFNSK